MNRRSFLASSLVPAFALPSAAQDALKTRPRLRTGLNCYSFRKELAAKTMTYDDVIRRAVEWDVDGVDMTVYWMPSTGPEFTLPLRRFAYNMGVEIYSISVRSELTKSSPSDRRKEVESLYRWIDVANSLGASHIRVFGGNVPKGVTEEQAVPWVVECLQRSADYAATKGVILGLENHGGICTRAERILEMVNKVNSPWVAVNLDTGNFRTEAFKQIELALPQSVNIQVKVEMLDDSGKRVRQDWDRVVRLIAASGYKGYLALEYEAEESALQAVPRLMAQLRELTRKYSA
ncbi:MAG: sugar phosphate isomerase/epimerase [Bryobacteraceae bacterium]|nr:sugar phosphate isomerase/epimerase [Bryobacteraceae bacterium]